MSREAWKREEDSASTHTLALIKLSCNVAHASIVHFDSRENQMLKTRSIRMRESLKNDLSSPATPHYLIKWCDMCRRDGTCSVASGGLAKP